MKKKIWMRATASKAREYGYAAGAAATMIEVEVDLDALTPAARWIAEHVTATYIKDEHLHKCKIVAECGWSMAERDRANGVTESLIQQRSEYLGEAYTARMQAGIADRFPTLSSNPETPEKVFEALVRDLHADNVVALHCDGDTYDLRKDNPIAYYRRVCGMTQVQLAEKSGVSYGALMKLENGQRDIMSCKLDTVLPITRALGITVEELVQAAEKN